MARSFGAESLGADGFAVRGAVSAAPAVGCALVELGSNQLGWTSAPVVLNSDLSLKANRAGDTFTGDVIINRTWLGTPTEDKNVIKVGRYQSGSNATVNSPIAWYEHIADAPYPYCGFVLKHGLNPSIVDGRNPGGSYINMIGPEHSFAIQFDYLSSVGTPNYQGDAQYNLTGPQSKHIFRVNNGTEVGRFDANGLTASTGKLFLANSASNATWQARAEFGDLNIETLSGTTNSIYLRANSGKSIVQNIAGTNVSTVSSTGLTVVGDVRSTVFYPLAYAGAPGGCSISASGGSSGTMVLSCGGAQQISLADTRMTVPSSWMIDFTNGNWNQTIEARIIRSSPNVIDIRANSGLRVRTFDGTAAGNLQAGAATLSSNLLFTGTNPTITFPSLASLSTTDIAAIQGGANRYFLRLTTGAAGLLDLQGNGSLVLGGLMTLTTTTIRSLFDGNSPTLAWGVNKMSITHPLGGYRDLEIRDLFGSGTITQGAQDARWTIPATGQRDSQVGNGSGTWQTGYREEYNVGGVRAGFFGATPVAQQSIAAAATDSATTQTLANSLRTAMLNLGLGV